jgi:hypothetical protein
MVLGAVMAFWRPLRALVPLVPERFRWLPGAVISAVGALQVTLPGATSDLDVVVAIVSAVTPLVLAAAQGYQPEASE